MENRKVVGDGTASTGDPFLGLMVQGRGAREEAAGAGMGGRACAVGSEDRDGRGVAGVCGKMSLPRGRMSRPQKWPEGEVCGGKGSGDLGER